ncbi:MAG: glycosyltransferase [Lachnospiraceae bacterium]|nr:glycosyltransferase [Lachnospiraceae bacterium]
MKKVSVIVPCYNAENYIDRCMDSIIRQTIGIENLEIVLVNDASTDHTLDKLCEWEQKYPDSVLVITYDENLRQGGAMNIGMQHSSGEYLAFSGVDDWMELDMYETLYRIASEEKYDIVQGKFQRDAEYHVPVLPDADSSFCNHYVYHFEHLTEDYYQHQVDNMGTVGEYGCTTTAIYRRSLIMDHQIFFPEGLAFEDNYWSAVLNLYTKNLYLMDKIVYHYYTNPHSTVSSRNSLRQLDRLVIETMILEEYRKRGLFDLCYRELEWRFVNKYYLATMYAIFTKLDMIPVDLMNDMRRTVVEQFPHYRENSNVRACLGRRKDLIDLLEIDEDLTLEQWMKVKLTYLESLYGQ